MQKLEKYLFFLFIFCIPFQTRLILANWAPTRVGFNEWTSAFLHGTDILITLLLIFWLIRVINDRTKIEIKFSSIKSYHIFLLLFFVVSTLSITVSGSKSLSVYQWIKLVEFIIFYFYIRSSLGKIFTKNRLLEVLVLSGFFQAVIAILQYIIQGALGLRILGESPITAGGAGVASFYVGSQVFLRAYGSFPHPNILATFLMIGIFSFYYLYFNRESSYLHGMMMRVKEFLTHRVKGAPLQSERLWKSDVIGYFIYGAMLYAFFLTYSRTVIGLMGLGLIIFLAVLIWQNMGIRFLHDKRFYTLVLVSLVVVLLFLGLNFQQALSRALISGSDEAVSLRIFYDKIAGQTTGHYPWLGVGIGAFVPKLMKTLSHIPSYYYQPVHNIYLLISAETGILGLASFSIFLFFLIRNFIKKETLKDPNKLGLLLVCLTLLSIGLFDHLIWTIQQGRILFWLVLALLA